VDWGRKPGPLAQYRQELHEELLKAENGGPGLEGETVVTPETNGADEHPVEVPPDGDAPAGGTNATEGAPPPDAPPMDTPPIEDLVEP
jgi:hypothetical protein